MVSRSPKRSNIRGQQQQQQKMKLYDLVTQVVKRYPATPDRHETAFSAPQSLCAKNTLRTKLEIDIGLERAQSQAPSEEEAKAAAAAAPKPMPICIVCNHHRAWIEKPHLSLEG